MGHERRDLAAAPHAVGTGVCAVSPGQAALAANRPRAIAAEPFRAAQEIAASLPSPPLLERLADAAARAGVRFGGVETNPGSSAGTGSDAAVTPANHARAAATH